MGLEDKLLSGILPTTAKKLVGYTRKNSVWPATFGLACCAVELLQASGPGTTWPDSAWNRHRLHPQGLRPARHLRPGMLRRRAVPGQRPRHDLARFGMEQASATPRQADLMILAGRVNQKMTPVLRQIYDQMAEPKCVISMGSAPPATGCSTTTPAAHRAPG